MYGSHYFDALPVELIADILGELDLSSLIKVSYLSRRLRAITSDSSLNPWRQPILRTLRDTSQSTPSSAYDPSLANLSVRVTVPRQNWVEILSIAKAEWLLFSATLPNLPSKDWQEAFRRRFLPGWQKWKKEGSWKEVFMKLLHRTWHRSHSSCTSDEAWTKYIVLNRNGSANELESSSRTFNPMTIFNEIKLQNNHAHMETHVRLVLELTDVRILALGVLHKPRSSFSVNKNAKTFLHPPGVEKEDHEDDNESDEWRSTHSENSTFSNQEHEMEAPTTEQQRSQPTTHANLNQTYRRLAHPLPAPSHACYPFYTPGGEDKRWLGSGESEEHGRQWIGSLMLTAQLIGPQTKENFTDGPPLQDMDLLVGAGRSQYSSFSWPDLKAIAPWLELTKLIDGPGLGH
ncbi:hypothetical protein QCA50_020140 [Cerrena zonata]|uniref:F-box domain-containing protein n=1 Tax=Cerrena zonata TaxID=2478898 RepID=A0AAW0FFK1_9APHY